MYYPLMFGGYGLYFLFALPALLLGMWAQFKVQSTFNKYSKIRNYTGLTGQEVARRILDMNGLHDVSIREIGGTLSDNYDPRKKILSLSAQVAQSNSVAAAGVAAHEVGHALQDQAGYAPMQMRSAIVPVVQIGSWLGPIIFIIGFLMTGVFGQTMQLIGVGLFAATAVFALITLPVELNASHRAKQLLVSSGLVYGNDAVGVNKVLDAAALTYVAAAVQAVSTLLYYLFLIMGASSRRR
jgi:Zn-dependent membrane protease YugP